MEEKKISSAVIKRLPRYYRYLSELLEKGIDRISSHELSKKMNVRLPRSGRILIILVGLDSRDMDIM